MIKPLPSVDLITHEATPAHFERSDICVIPAAGVVGEAMVALVLGGLLSLWYQETRRRIWFRNVRLAALARRRARHLDQLLDTLVHMRAASNWSINLANGTYSVTFDREVKEVLPHPLKHGHAVPHGGGH